MCRVREFPLCNYPPTISGYPLHILEPSWEETCHKSVQSEISGTEVGLQHSAGGAGTTLMRAMGLSPGCTGNNIRKLVTSTETNHIHIILRPSSFTPGFVPNRNMHICVVKDLYKIFHSNIICNSLKLKTILKLHQQDTT